MITAICIDKKGFMKSFTIPQALPELNFPLLASATEIDWYNVYNPTEYKHLIFRSTHKVTRLDGNVIVEYREV